MRYCGKWIADFVRNVCGEPAERRELELLHMLLLLGQVLKKNERETSAAYTGRDKFYARYKDKYNDGEYAEVRDELGWGNLTAALRWNHVLNDRLFANTHLTFSRYQLAVGIEDKQVRRNPAGQQAPAHPRAVSVISIVESGTNAGIRLSEAAQKN